MVQYKILIDIGHNVNISTSYILINGVHISYIFLIDVNTGHNTVEKHGRCSFATFDHGKLHQRFRDLNSQENLDHAASKRTKLGWIIGAVDVHEIPSGYLT